MRRSTRLGENRINYKILNSTGQKIVKLAENLTPTMEENEFNVKIMTLSDAINDFIDENAIDDICNDVTEINQIIIMAENLRNDYRMQLNQAQIAMGEKFEQTFGKESVVILGAIKEHIKSLKHLKKKIIKSKTNNSSNVIKMKFLIDEIERISYNLEKVWKIVDLSNESDTDVKRRRRDLETQLKDMKALSSLFKDLVESSDESTSEKITQLHSRYKSLQSYQSLYIELLNKTINDREFDKHETFKSSLLNIKLPKFNGYQCSTDIYTFRQNFEKLYLKTTPSDLLPDLLKNNFLENPAHLLVKNVTSMDEIWKRLIDSYGDHKTLLSKKLSELQSVDLSWRIKDHSKIVESLSKIVNLMRDTMQLAEHHKIERKLYYGDNLNDIYKLLGENRLTRYLSSHNEDFKDGKEAWKQLIDFLEKEIRVNQQKILINKDEQPRRDSNLQRKQNSHFTDQNSNPEPTCQLCGSKDHIATNGPRGTKIVQYFACKTFTEMTPSQRYQTLRSKEFCVQCLYPGANQNSGKHKEGRCQRDFTCQNQSHANFTVKKHVLLCDEHKHTQQNKDLLEHYRSRCISRNQHLPEFSKSISVHFNESYQTKSDTSNERAIYMLQTITINGQKYTLFFDTGCSDFVCRLEATRRIGERSTQLSNEPVSMGGVGCSISQSNHGIYSVSLPLANGQDATFTGVCMDQIASKFPMYPLQGRVESDIHSDFKAKGGNPTHLPNLPSHVGGQIDFMIGIKYLRYFPEQVHQLPSGLTIYRSPFTNSDGSLGVIGGPHEVFSAIERQHHLSSSEFISNQIYFMQQNSQVSPDLKLRGYHSNNDNYDIFEPEEPIDKVNTISSVNTQSQQDFLSKTKKFENFETVGSEITFRCVNCRKCSTCKEHSLDESISIKEEVEQHAINNSVTVDISNCTTTAKLPLMHDPLMKLEPNRSIALKVYNQQVKRLQKNQEDRNDVIKSEKKLQDLGYVEYVKNMSSEIQEMLQSHPVQNFIPWRAVWKISSISTPCRIVYDASMPTNSGFSLNDILAKGRNNMNKLLEIFLRWRGYRIGFHTDIQKMYNSVKLDESHWCLQRYLWQKELDPDQPPDEKIIKTLIYGVKSSGNQAERGLRETVKIFKNPHPDVYRVVTEEVYVDDCLSGGDSINETKALSDNLEKTIAQGGFTLKGITMSGQNPHKSLSNDGTTISVAGMTWQPKNDLLSIDIKSLNFAKKYRGKKVGVISDIPIKLTRRDCTSKAAEVFDMAGFLTPITATLKLDLHDLVQRKLMWDDALPNNLRNLWVSHFEMIAEIKNITYQRAIVPINATCLQMDSLDFGDASESLICSSIYVRFPTPNGFSCQLIFSRSRLVPENQSLPRAELSAAVLSTHTGHVVRNALKRYHTTSYKFTDSQIVLHWICNVNRPLKRWVRSRIIEIQRFTKPADWKYINSSNMIADLGTKRCTSLNVIDQDSKWINGFSWMKRPACEFPAMSAREISLSQAELQEARKETQNNHESSSDDPSKYAQSSHLSSILPDAVKDRYAFSSYIIDPNRHRFNSIIRILAIVIKFIRNLRFYASRPGKYRSSLRLQKFKSSSALFISEPLIKEAECYFFKKATQEVKQFVKPSKYIKISREKDGVMFYTGRILPNDSISIIGKATKAMIDLTSTSFCVPIIERYSPLAYSIVNEIHWYHSTASHKGIETTWRYLLQKVFIIEGRYLVKEIRSTCERCRYLTKRTIDVIMGPVSQDNLMIAPAYYVTQVDLCGPFQSFSYHNKRATVKIWLVVFCCSTTSTTNIKVMEDYSTSAFLQSFTRFSCEVGYPKKLTTDEGSQLVKGCSSMKFDLKNLHWKLQTQVNVEFETCPVGGHNMNGRVERKIKEIKISITKSTSNLRLSIMQWETFAARTANCINDLPLAIRDIKGDFEASDLITPNRLRLGRNNDRSPTGSFRIDNNPEKIINQNQQIFDAWFELWLTCHVPSLIPRPKWFRSDTDISVGDVVLFTKHESILTSSYQFGIVDSVDVGRDGKIRKVFVRYRNSSENTDRITFRSTRTLVVIHRASESNLMHELYQAERESQAI